MAKNAGKNGGGGLGRTGRDNGLTAFPKKKKMPVKKTATAKAKTRKA